MRGRKYYSYGHSIQVTVENVQYLHRFLSDNFDNITYSAYCVDNTELQPSSLEELLKYENPPFKRIMGLKIKGSSQQPSGPDLELQIGQSKEYHSQERTVEFTLRYDDVNWGTKIERELIDRLEELRPWYWWLKKVQFKWFLPVGLYVLSLVVNLISLIQKLRGIPTSTSTPSSFTEGEGQTFAILLFGSLFIVGSMLDSFINYLLPKIFFVFGKQIAEYKRRQNIAYFIFVIIILGIILEFVGSRF